MFNTKLKERLIKQEITIARLREDLKFSSLRASDAESKIKILEEQLDSFAGIDEEEVALERQLRKEELRRQIAATQIDKQKEVEEAYKPAKFN